jgi:hypothetical protein
MVANIRFFAAFSAKPRFCKAKGKERGKGTFEPSFHFSQESGGFIPLRLRFSFWDFRRLPHDIYTILFLLSLDFVNHHAWCVAFIDMLRFPISRLFDLLLHLRQPFCLFNSPFLNSVCLEK